MGPENGLIVSLEGACAHVHVGVVLGRGDAAGVNDVGSAAAD